MKHHTYQFKACIWLYPGKAGWHFITLPQPDAAEIKSLYGSVARGWRSLPVIVQIGKTKWKTSIFPDTKTSSYLLPVKSAVRKAESIVDGDTVQVTLTINTDGRL